MSFILVLIIFIVLLLFYNYYWKRLGLPPGPAPLPLFGNLLSMRNRKRFEYQFVDWAKKYGPIYTYWLGGLPAVAVNDAKLAHQLFIKDGENFVDRSAQTVNVQAILDENDASDNKEILGIINTDGQRWQDQRRFTLRFLRDFGLGKNQMQERILEEVKTVIENVNKDIDSGLVEHDLYKYSDIAIGSIINSLIFGYRFTENNNDTEFYRLKEWTNQMLKDTDTILSLLITFNRWIANFFVSYSKFIKIRYEPIHGIFDFIDRQINQKIKTDEIDEDAEEPRDLVDAFLIEKARQKRLGLPTADLYTIPQLRGLVFDLWLAGQETTSNTITWAIAYLIVYPNVQEKIHEELDKIIGSDRIITVSDKQQLNYLNAFIMEVQRASNIVAQNILRVTAQDVEINGMKIKKGTYILPQISAMHYDEKIFPNPDLLKPERFLDKNGHLVKNDSVLAFSLGKRACPGESLARMELFLFLANLCNQYKFSSGKEEPILEKITAGATSMKSFKCVIEKRPSS